MRVLLLTSYCDPDNKEENCSEEFPCIECLKMCNIIEVRGEILKNYGGYEFVKEFENQNNKTKD